MAKETLSRAEADAAIEAMKKGAARRGVTIDVQRQLLDVETETLHVQANVYPPAPVGTIQIVIGKPEK